MKIIYLHQYFNTPKMSGGTRSYEMAKRMTKAGHEVHMITSHRDTSDGKKRWELTSEDGINVHWYPVPYSNKMNYLSRIISFFRFATAATKKASELKGDIIFATSTPLTIAIPAVLSARKNKIPMVFEVRDLWPELPIAIGALKNPIACYIAQKLERWAYKNSSAIVALSNGMKDGIVKTGYPSSRVAVIPNSSDNKEFSVEKSVSKAFRSERPWLANGPLLVYGGTFGKINGVGYMVDLANALKAINSDVCILLVGDGQERDAIINSAKSQGVYGENLFYEKQLPKDKMPALLDASTMAASLFIDLPEMRSNSANKFFDALAAGKPVFLNYGGWMHELIQKHECGISGWDKPISEVAAELHRNMHNSNWVNSAGNSAKKLAIEMFDRDLLASKLLNVLTSTLEGHPESAENIAPNY